MQKYLEIYKLDFLPWFIWSVHMKSDWQKNIASLSFKIHFYDGFSKSTTKLTPNLSITEDIADQPYRDQSSPSTNGNQNKR